MIKITQKKKIHKIKIIKQKKNKIMYTQKWQLNTKS